MGKKTVRTVQSMPCKVIRRRITTAAYIDSEFSCTMDHLSLEEDLAASEKPKDRKEQLRFAEQSQG